MNVLLVNKFHYRRRGAEAVYLDTASLLRRKGHRVMEFSMVHPLNEKSPTERFFVDEVDFASPRGPAAKFRALSRMFYSFESQAKLKALLSTERPDIAHLHNIYHQLSPSILPVLRRAGIPTVMTMHDFKVVCPAYTLWRKGSTCERCRGGRFHRAVFGRCVKSSVGKSALCAAEMFLHRRILRLYDRLDLSICPSLFMARKLADLGFRSETAVLSNFVDLDRIRPSGTSPERAISFVGGDTPEKGLPDLLAAVRDLDVELRVFGAIREQTALQEHTAGNNRGRVVFRGRLPAPELAAEIAKTMFLVVPSVWYENNPLAIMEAFALGKPVVASRIGGIPELVRDGETGLLFDAGDRHDLRAKIKRLLDHPEETARLGGRARRYAEERLSPDIHYAGLLALYQRARLRRTAP